MPRGLIHAGSVDDDARERAEDEPTAVLLEEPGPVEEAGGRQDAVVEPRDERRRRRGRRDRRRRERGEPGRADREEAEEAEEAEEQGAEEAPPRPSRRILINATDEEEIRIAVLEDGRLNELYFERTADKKYLGNIYKGRVVNLEPAIQAAFVDLGIGRNGFLHVSDVLPVYKDAPRIPIENLSLRNVPDWKKLRIQDILRKGQEVLVQISKDSIGAKGPSLTTYISVPGKYLVLMPGVNRHGVSKRIQDSAERAELRDKLASLNPPPGIGYIVRTAGQDKPQDVLAKDFEYLMGVWDEIDRGTRQGPVPSLVYAESDLVIRAMRDFFATEVDEVLIDEPEVYERARRFLLDVMPEAARRLKAHTGGTPLFTRYRVEEAIDRIYNRRVPLPNGGHLVIEQTEALVAIDVNSGKYRSEEDLEATALNTNLEAAEEIARQLRLRDLGGVIIIDFIDMEVSANRRSVERALRNALREDRAKSWFTRISRFGIVEMTRQRVRASFERANYEPCKLCGGTGVAKSTRNVGTAILRELRATLGSRRRTSCEVLAYPDVTFYLLNERRRSLLDLEAKFQKTINVRAEPALGPENYSIRYP